MSVRQTRSLHPGHRQLSPVCTPSPVPLQKVTPVGLGKAEWLGHGGPGCTHLHEAGDTRPRRGTQGPRTRLAAAVSQRDSPGLRSCWLRAWPSSPLSASSSRSRVPSTSPVPGQPPHARSASAAAEFRGAADNRFSFFCCFLPRLAGTAVFSSFCSDVNIISCSPSVPAEKPQSTAETKPSPQAEQKQLHVTFSSCITPGFGHDVVEAGQGPSPEAGGGEGA